MHSPLQDLSCPVSAVGLGWKLSYCKNQLDPFNSNSSYQSNSNKSIWASDRVRDPKHDFGGVQTTNGLTGTPHEKALKP